MRLTRPGAARFVTSMAVPLSLLLSGVFVWRASYAAFTDTSATAPNTFATGTVDISTDREGLTIFTGLTGLKPHATENILDPPASSNVFTDAGVSGGSACVLATYSGSATADVRLFATVTEGADPAINTTLADKIIFSVDVAPWTVGAANLDCSTFEGGSTTYIHGLAQNNATVGGTRKYLSDLPTTWSGAVNTQWPAATTNAKKWYRLSWLFPANTVGNDAQNESLTVVFTWEAQQV